MNDPLAEATAQAAHDAKYKRTMLEFALLYAREGHRVLPLHSIALSRPCVLQWLRCKKDADLVQLIVNKISPG